MSVLSEVGSFIKKVAANIADEEIVNVAPLANTFVQNVTTTPTLVNVVAQGTKFLADATAAQATIEGDALTTLASEFSTFVTNVVAAAKSDLSSSTSTTSNTTSSSSTTTTSTSS